MPYHSLPVVGALPDIIRRGFFDVTMDALARNGSPIRLPVLHRDYYAIGHPDHVKHVVVDNRENYRRTHYFETMQLAFGRSTLTTDGEWWRERRAIMRPALGRGNVESMVEIMATPVDEMLKRWSALPAGHVLDLMPEMLILTLEIVTCCMFGTQLRIDTRRLASHFETIQRYFRRSSFLPLSIPLYEKLPMPLGRKFRRAIAELDREFEELIKQRRARPQKDLLSIVIQLKDEHGGGLNDREVRDEVMTLLHSGHETSMLGILWTFFLIGTHPQVREQLEAEIDRVLGNRPPTLADLSRLPYAERVFRESLRLYPPVPAFSRNNLEDDRIGDVTLPAGSFLNTMIWAVHLHPEFWSRPHTFDPERFSPERMKRRHAFAYLPFGAGAHRCIGYRMAMLEGMLALVMIAQRFRLEPVAGAEAAPRARITLRPRHGMPMTLRPRC
jgi:cytochrome P450